MIAPGDSWTILHYESVDSTQRIAASLIADGTPHRTVVVAERQTAGYGRKGDLWHDLPGASLLMTIIVRPRRPTTGPPYAMIAALACIEAIRAISGLIATIKWPNDVLLNGRKVAGILGDATWRDTHLEALRIGIGVNIAGERALFHARGLPDASSVAAEARCPTDRARLLAALLVSFAHWEDQLVEARDAEIVAAWRASLSTIGRHVVAVRAGGSVTTGVASSVTDEGDLIVITDAGDNEHLRAADVRSLRHRE
jgi:BirA family biotin operon repressor/biotin-[acetyl-CoA-carboxylase] ligase